MKKFKFVALVILSLTYSIAGFSPVVAAPAAPTNVQVVDASLSGAATNAAQVQISWTAVSGALAYVVTATATGETHLPKTVTPGTATQVIFDGLTGGVSYNFVVASKDASGETPAAAVSFVPHSVPNLPTVGKIDIGAGQVTLHWSAPSNSGGIALTGFTISAVGIPNSTVAGTATSAVIPDPSANPAYTLSAGSSYSFQIIAINALGSSGVANFATVTMPSRPLPPTGISGTVSGSTISTTWVAPTTNIDAPITGYTAHIYDQSGSEVSAKIGYPKTNSYDFTGMSAGTYTVKVAATNIGGESDLSAASSPQVVATTGSLTTNNVRILPTTISDRQIDSTVSVTASADSGGTVALSASPNSICSITNGVVLAKAAGRCTITGTVDKSGNYDVGVGTRDFYVVKVPQSINFSTITSQTLPGPVSINVTSSSSIPVVVTASGQCTIIGTNVSFLGAGTCTLTASAAETLKYFAATNVVRTFTISEAATSSNMGGGGGAPIPPTPPIPAPTPTVTPSTTPSPSVSPAPNVSASPTPSFAPKPTPTPSTTPSTSPSPSPSPFKVVKPFQIVTSKPSKSGDFKGNGQKISMVVNKSLQLNLGKVSKGTLVTQTLKGPTGTFAISTSKSKATGAIKTPILKFTKEGTYTFTVIIGKVKKVITIKVTK